MKRLLLLLLFCSGCITTRNHTVKIEADKFIGTIPGFGEVNVENFRYWKTPAKAKNDEEVYEIPSVFWEGKEQRKEEGR